MSLVFGCLVLFFMITFLLVTYHCFFWSFDWVVLSGLRSWVSSFECGFLCGRLVENYFSYTYFVLLVFFVIFDLEVSLLLCLPFQGVMFKNLYSFFFFIFFVCLGFTVEVFKGYVVWSY